ncbi:hypothetical protein B484DRAFT_404703 [Ochromonadaceae sp. CCMP2298]|nr:hypothetical protein B484DRAFT_404703 [Ochromonadaceae sp. CCMP2298]
MDGQDNQQQQQQGLQTASQDTGTADSSLEWGLDVSYHWLVGMVGLSYADVCGVRADDPNDVFRLVAFHYEDGSGSAASLAESIPRREDRWRELPADVEQEVQGILYQHARQYEEVRAGPLTQAELHY